MSNIEDIARNILVGNATVTTPRRYWPKSRLQSRPLSAIGDYEGPDERTSQYDIVANIITNYGGDNEAKQSNLIRSPTYFQERNGPRKKCHAQQPQGWKVLIAVYRLLLLGHTACVLFGIIHSLHKAFHKPTGLGAPVMPS